MQKPVYARKAELMPTEKKVSTHNAISKGVVAKNYYHINLFRGSPGTTSYFSFFRECFG